VNNFAHRIRKRRIIGNHNAKTGFVNQLDFQHVKLEHECSSTK